MALLVCFLLITVVCGGVKASIVNKDTRLKFVSQFHANDNKKFTDCHQLKESGYNTSGIYTLHLNESYTYQIRCEFTDDNAFNIIQMRINGLENFHRSFYDYQFGFGYATGDHWIGLEQIFKLTQTGNNVLTVYLSTWNGDKRNAKYNYFRIVDRVTFTLQIGHFAGGNLADDLSFNNGRPFNTPDRPDPSYCAVNQGCGWWFNYCSYALPNGRYYWGGHYVPSTTFYDGIYWKDFAGYDYSMKTFHLQLSRF